MHPGGGNLARSLLAGLALTLSLCYDPALAQEPPCSVRDRSDAVAVVVCRAGLTLEEWRQAAEAACADLRACSAWIWEDPDKAPLRAPKLATGFAKSSILSSVAIWDHDSRRMVLIEKAN